MAVPAYATDLTDIYTDTDGFTAVGGGRITASETDDYIQGNNCWSHDPFSSNIEGGIYGPSSQTIAASDAVYIWTKCDVAATLATHAAGGIQLLVGSSATVYDCFYALGSDDYQYGGWKCIPVDPTLTPSTSVGTPTGTSYFGVRWNVPSTGASKGYPMKIDAIRQGRTIEITAGEVANPATWDATAIYDSTTTRQWGICQPTNSGAEIQGLVYWGTAAASVYSRDSNRTITVIDTEWTSTDFTQVLFAHASNDVVWDNVGLLALGTNNRGIIDVTANGTITWTNSVFQGIDITNMLSNSTFDGSKWLGTNEVDSGGGSLLNAKILTPTVAIDSYGLLWNVAADPDGSLDGMEFSKGANAHHAIEFGLSAPLSITLRNCNFSGFNATTGQNDSTFNVLRTTGTVTINIVGGSGSVGYKTAGATVNIVLNPVTTSVTVKNIETQALITGARVLMEVASGVNFPYLASVTATRAGSVVTVTHTSHGLTTGNKIRIRGADDNAYNGIKTITVTGTNTYTYAITGTPTTPAAGTLTATMVIIDGVTDGSGYIADTRSYSSSQPITGRVRQASAGTAKYVTQPISGTINNSAGLPLTVQLVPDE
jgi:hypothetical protein